jgi:hypothetical protein
MVRRLKIYLLGHFEAAVLVLSILGILLMAFVVLNKFSFLNYFFLPVILSGYFLGKRRAVLTAVFCFLLVVLYLIYVRLSDGPGGFFQLHEIFNLVTWGGFLILTGALIGSFSEQRESKLEKLRNAYVGTLEIMLKFLESANEAPTPWLRTARLSGRIAAAAGLETAGIENIKTAALLSMAGDLGTNLPLFVEMTDFMTSEREVLSRTLGDREKVMLRSTSSLLKEIEPLLQAYYFHYVQRIEELEKDLDNIPLGSSIIALARAYDRISQSSAPLLDSEEFKTLGGLQKLGGRTFHKEAVDALLLVAVSR